METKFYDFLNNELNIGDNVVFTNPTMDGHTLDNGKIVEFFFQYGIKTSPRIRIHTDTNKSGMITRKQNQICLIKNNVK